MRGFIAVTDPGWYERLFALGTKLGPMDANFWRPSPRRVALASGTPFLFKLRAPANAIAGFGFFVSFSVLPDWLAWDTFGEANGVASLDELRARLRRIREGADIEADPQGRIGCSLIAEARFFARDQWVAAPSDWKPRTQTGTSVDLTTGEGLRVWNECLARVRDLVPHEREPTVPQQPRFGAPVTYLPRLGQGIFRVQVLDAYARACAVTNEHSLVVLDAAHVRPYAAGGEHDVRNGLAVRTDLHKLLDRGYVTVDHDMKFVVGRRLKQDFDNGRSYYELHGRLLALPSEAALRPAIETLAWHRENVFLG
jgi:putative restriction endonuclease